jgi:hypothetical protein
LIAGPPRSNAEEMGRQPSPPVVLAGADSLVSRRPNASDDAQIGDEYIVGERAEGGAPIAIGERTSRLRLPLGESLNGLLILLIRSDGLCHGPSHGLRPVLATEVANRIPLGKRCLSGRDASRERLLQFQVDSLRDPCVLLGGYPDQTDRDLGRFGKGQLECLHPLTGIVRGILIRDEQEVAPVEVGVVQGAHEYMVPAVLNGGAAVLKGGDVGRPTGRAVACAATFRTTSARSDPVLPRWATGRMTLMSRLLLNSRRSAIHLGRMTGS